MHDARGGLGFGMASIGHVAVGLAAAKHERAHQRPQTGSLVFWMILCGALSMLPDADVVGFRFGIRYQDAFGHRGASHSVLFALVVGPLLAWPLRRFGFAFRRTAIMLSLVLLSHPLLDTLTDGGLGCALLWPLDDTRYFAPWRPLPVAPIGAAFFTHGLPVALTELVVFSPFFLYALWPRKRDEKEKDR